MTDTSKRKSSRRAKDSTREGAKSKKERTTNSRDRRGGKDDRRVLEDGRDSARRRSKSSAARDRERRDKAKRKSKARREPLERPLGKSRVYADVNAGYPASRFDIESFKLRWGDVEKYTVEDMVGQGAYGEVYKAFNSETESACVVKTIRPEKEEKIKIQRELMMLNLVQGGPNIVQVHELVEDPSTNLKMIVFEYVENPDFRRVYAAFDPGEEKIYLLKLLKALHFTHSQGIIHRDVKPRNVLYNPATRSLRLIDWGFGEFYFPEKPIPKWPGTRHYKSPDLFLHYEHYDYSVDMWAFGAILGAIVFRRIPMFRGREDSLSQMQAICKTLGSDGLFTYMSKYSMPLRKKYREEIRKKKRTPWSAYIYGLNQHLASEEAVDLLDKLLVWDHEKRLTAVEALEHPYFAGVGDTSTSTQATTSDTSDTTASRSDENDNEVSTYSSESR